MKKGIKKLLGDKLWRQLKIADYTRKNPGFVQMTADNVRFKDIHKGKRCFIIGNGPSLKKVNFSLLQDEITFTVNQLPRNKDFGKLKTNYHVWADEQFFQIDANNPEDQELLQVMLNVAVSDNPPPQVFYKATAKPMIDTFHLDESLNIAFFSEVYTDDVLKALKYGIDLCKPLPSFSTVIHYALCIAIYMGFSEIYLLGCDCSGFISSAQRKLENAEGSLYAYTISEHEKKRMEKTSENTRFSDELRWYADLFESYDAFAIYCADNHIKLYNATESSLLEGVPKVHLADILSVEMS